VQNSQNTVCYFWTAEHGYSFIQLLLFLNHNDYKSQLHLTAEHLTSYFSDSYCWIIRCVIGPGNSS